MALVGRRLSSRQHALLLSAMGRFSPLTIMMEEGPGLSERPPCLARDFAVRLIPRQAEKLAVAEIRELLEENP